MLCELPASGETAPAGNHRGRVAEVKRARMRERLIEATIAAYGTCEPGDHPVVDDVIRIAAVSRGSFYKHFEAIDQVFSEIGRRMAGEMLATYSLLAAPLADAAARVALGPLMALTRAAMEPRHGALVARVDFVDFLASGGPGTDLVALSLEQGRAAGVLRFQDLDAAADLLVGTCVEGARRMVRSGRRDPAYAREIAAMVLRALGVPEDRTPEAIDLAGQRLASEAAQLSWWRPAV